jgi:hypothetical protein
MQIVSFVYLQLQNNFYWALCEGPPRDRIGTSVAVFWQADVEPNKGVLRVEYRLHPCFWKELPSFLPIHLPYFWVNIEKIENYVSSFVICASHSVETIRPIWTKLGTADLQLILRRGLDFLFSFGHSMTTLLVGLNECHMSFVETCYTPLLLHE